MAVAWVGGALTLIVLGHRIGSTAPEQMASFGHNIDWVAKRVFIPASLTAVVTGVLMVIDSDFYGFGDDWIVLGLVLYATTFLAGLLFLSPESARIGKLTQEGSPEAPARTMRLIFLARRDPTLLFLIIYVMTVKPQFGGEELWIGVVGALVAGGLFFWRYRAALERMASMVPPSAPPAEATES